MRGTKRKGTTAPNMSTVRIIRSNTRRQVLALLVRVCLVITILSALYVLAPLDRRPDDTFALRVIASLMVLGAVVTWQIVAVTHSPSPWLRGIEGIAISTPLLLLLFASAYVVVSAGEGGSFSERLTRLDSIYFTVTVFATVGFGDIAPNTNMARSLVTIQMLVDLVFIGVVAKVLFGAVRQRKEVLDGAVEEGG